MGCFWLILVLCAVYSPSNVSGDEAEIGRYLSEARQAQTDGDVKLAAEKYARSIEMILGTDDGSVWRDRIATVIYARWLTLREAGLDPSDGDLEQLTKAIGEWSEKQREQALEFLLQAARDKLKAGLFVNAESFYRNAAAISPEKYRSVAKLGEAWSLYARGDVPGESLEMFGRFLSQFPHHRDSETVVMASFKIMNEHGFESEEVDRWLLDNADFGSQRFDRAIKAYIVDQVFPKADEASKLRVISEFSRLDDAGLIESLLDQLQHEQRARVIARWLSVEAETVSDAALTIAANRARTSESWENLVELSRHLEVDQLTTETSPEVIHAVAESLVQTGRVRASLEWWNSLLKLHPTDELAIHIRRAEAEVSSGQDVGTARERISDLRRRVAASDSDIAVSAEPLIDSLAAELAIREADLPGARGLLERVIRGVEIPSVMKARAQWLIGETYAASGMYVEAIEAYRLVESIAMGSDGKLDESAKPWVAASLVQAGSAFEQLGRTRQAQMCYGSLLARFGDSPHAEQARLRVASMRTPGAVPNTNNSSETNPTLRR